MRSVATLDGAELLLNQRRVSAARLLFNLAEAQGADPDRCAAGRWMAAMLSGNCEAAWRESDSIRHRNKPDPHRLWNGRTWARKRVMIRCLHGFGDAIQFLRYAPQIRAEAASLVAECAPRAAELIRCLPGIDEVVTWEQQPPAWDVQMELMELPYIFRSTVADLPIATNYLCLPGNALACAAEALGPRIRRPRIGVAWSCGEWNLTRSLPLPLLEPILQRQEFEFWNLQGGTIRKQWREVACSGHLRDTALLADAGLVSLAATTAQLDLVITVDTLAAHLAGSLGVPCFVLLQHAADWRWMLDRDDSPWYPSLRLFRQPAAGDWESVVRDVGNALAVWSHSRGEVSVAA